MSVSPLIIKLTPSKLIVTEASSNSSDTSSNSSSVTLIKNQMKVHDLITRFSNDNLVRLPKNLSQLISSSKKQEWCNHSINYPDSSNNNKTPLMRVIETGSPRCINILLRNGANPNSVTQDGRSVLMLAVELAARHLLSATSSSSASPFQRKNAIKIIKRLCEESTLNFSYQDAQNTTALMQALAKGDKEVANLLTKGHQPKKRRAPKPKQPNEHEASSFSDEEFFHSGQDEAFSGSDDDADDNPDDNFKSFFESATALDPTKFSIQDAAAATSLTHLSTHSSTSSSISTGDVAGTLSLRSSPTRPFNSPVSSNIPYSTPSSPLRVPPLTWQSLFLGGRTPNLFTQNLATTLSPRPYSVQTPKTSTSPSPSRSPIRTITGLHLNTNASLSAKSSTSATISLPVSTSTNSLMPIRINNDSPTLPSPKSTTSTNSESSTVSSAASNSSPSVAIRSSASIKPATTTIEVNINSTDSSADLIKRLIALRDQNKKDKEAVEAIKAKKRKLTEIEQQKAAALEAEYRQQMEEAARLKAEKELAEKELSEKEANVREIEAIVASVEGEEKESPTKRRKMK